MTTEKQDACDHKFVGSRNCLKCGWTPSAAVIAARLNPMHVVPAPALSPEERAERAFDDTLISQIQPLNTAGEIAALKRGYRLGYLAALKEKQ